jgi:hypothetical protein
MLDTEQTAENKTDRGLAHVDHPTQQEIRLNCNWVEYEIKKHF